jgi:hypothetical protein
VQERGILSGQGVVFPGLVTSVLLPVGLGDKRELFVELNTVYFGPPWVYGRCEWGSSPYGSPWCVVVGGGWSGCLWGQGAWGS